MNFKDLKVGLRLISPQGDIFEVCGIDTLKEEVLVKVVEFSTKDHTDEDPMDRYGHEFTAGNSGWISECGRFVPRRGFYEVCYRDLSLWSDDIPNFKEGDIVKDLDGNKYKIAFVGNVRSIPDIYKLELLDLRDKYSVRTGQLGIAFEDVGGTCYIYNSQNDAVLNGDYTGIYQLFATELKLTEFTPRPDEIPVAPKEAKPVAPVNAKRPSIEEIREITAQAENADLDKALDEIYPKILEAAERGEHTVVLENDMVDSLKLQVYGYLSDAGFMVRELFMGDSFEIKW